MPTSRPISWFLEQDESGAYRLFDIERGSEVTWIDAHQVAFIRNVLRGDNIGTVTMTYRQEDGDDVYTLIDGYQRLVSCYLYTVCPSWKVGGRSFAELSQGEQEQFLEYQIPVNEIYVSSNEASVSP